MRELKSVDALFEGRHFHREVITLSVRWYLRGKLSLRDLAEMMAERGLSIAHTTIMRWVQHYAPEFEKRWQRFARAVGRSWRVDETYVKIRGEWCYLSVSSATPLRPALNEVADGKEGLESTQSGPSLGASVGRRPAHETQPDYVFDLFAKSVKPETPTDLSK